MSLGEHPWVLGVSASHNGSACLLKGDEIVVAIQEERLCRFKRQRIYGSGPSLLRLIAWITLASNLTNATWWFSVCKDDQKIRGTISGGILS